jgi:hypothetical protein
LTVIVTENDLDALRKYPGTEADAPPVASVKRLAGES